MDLGDSEASRNLSSVLSEQVLTDYSSAVEKLAKQYKRKGKDYLYSELVKMYGLTGDQVKEIFGDDEFFNEEYARIAESIKIDHMNSLLQKAKVAEEEKRDIISEVGSFFEGIQKPEDIDSEQKLKLCISFGEICPDYNKGRFADCLGRYYEEIGQGSIHDALKWYTIGMNYGFRHSTRRVKTIKSKLKR